MNAAAYDVALTERFLRVTNLIDPPTRLQDPALVPRIVMGNLRALFAQTRTRARKALAAGNASGRLRPPQTRPSTIAGQ